MVMQFCVQVTGTCFLAHWEMENGWQTQDVHFTFSIGSLTLETMGFFVAVVGTFE